MNDTGRELTQQDILSLEKNLGASLPDDFVNFLTKHNGGEPEQSYISFDGESINVKGDEISFFYGIDTGSEDILKSFTILKTRNPEGLVPIADTAAGNFFLISIRDDSFGHVFYRDHEYEDSREMNFSDKILPSGIIHVRKSFDEFLSDLTE